MRILPKYSPYVLNTFECGCQIQSELKSGMGAKIIEYCPLHAAAPEMYEALKAIINVRTANHETEAAYIPPEIELAYKALAKAEGKK